MFSSGSTTGFRPRFALPALACAVALTLGACGSSSTTTVTTTTGSTASTGTSTSSTTTTTTSTASTTSTSSTSAPSATRQAFETALRQNLLQQQKLTQAQADCVVQKLRDSVSDAQIQQVVTSGNLPKDVKQAATQAGGICAVENP